MLGYVGVCLCVVVVGGCLGEGWWGCRGSVLGWEGVWVCVCGLKYPGFEVLYFNFLYNYGTIILLSL